LLIRPSLSPTLLQRPLKFSDKQFADRRLFVGAYADTGEIAALRSQRDATTDDDESERRAQASGRDTVDAGIYD
jgi:hypothetical protein